MSSIPNPGSELPPEHADEVHNAVRAIRERTGYTLEQLSLTCGLSLQEITEIEDGRDTDPEKLRRIAAALQLPESVFFSDEDRTAA
ncbi:helix-turn-helix transcriptional regulator [Mesorhizobium sp. BAC0120]|uniref:helix-turn-helix domain-containing protein n=1 Tax=Mesorhizobium sp. BAC0120 TaxID=3090670 RepID=UPI00298C7ED6|nr:helix-turn-helix transcriptional regulator [Mesorhizobium sp. BAC0120]MDW6023044.1 helix-turn-helix transcriptional regulator [Mesorhizobium sp. BAC0120]